MTARLASGVFVSALIRRVEIGGGSAYVARRGAAESGSVALKLVDTALPFGAPSATALTRATLGDGRQGWSWLIGPEPHDGPEVDAKLARQSNFDPDLWIVEIEDRDAARHIDDPIA